MDDPYEEKLFVIFCFFSRNDTPGFSGIPLKKQIELIEIVSERII